MRLNNLSAPNLINVNQNLKIPSNVEEVGLSIGEVPETTKKVEAAVKKETIFKEAAKISKNDISNKSLSVQQISDKYSIKAHSRIDNVAGERDRRIQWLTGGVTSADELYALTKEIEVPIWNGTEEVKKNLRVNEKLAEAIQNVFTELADKQYPIEFADNYGYEVEGYEYRTTDSGRLSDHAYGSAIDINAVHNPMTKPKNALEDNDGSQYVVTEEVVDIFAKYGFYWGGDWNSCSDAMHFSFTGW